MLLVPIFDKKYSSSTSWLQVAGAGLKSFVDLMRPKRLSKKRHAKKTSARFDGRIENDSPLAHWPSGPKLSHVSFTVHVIGLAL